MFTRFEKAKETLEVRMNSSSKLAIFIQMQEKNPQMKRQTLSGLLIHPVQHIGRYALLFKDIKKATPESHNDHARLDKLIETCDDVMRCVLSLTTLH